MTCRDVQAKLTAYLDGELDAARSSALRGHLRVCDGCRACAEDHARLRDVLAELPPADPPSAVWNGVMARLAEAEKVDGRRSRLALIAGGLWHRIRPQLWPAAAIVGVAAIALVWVARDRSDGDAGPMAERSDRTDPPGLTERTERIDVPAPAPPAPVADRPEREIVDIEASLAVELARIDDLYATSAQDLIDELAAETHAWSPDRRRSHDAELARLRAAVASTPPVDMADGTRTEDPFDAADRVAAQRDRRERAWQRLITFLQRAALGEVVAMRGPR